MKSYYYRHSLLSVRMVLQEFVVISVCVLTISLLASWAMGLDSLWLIISLVFPLLGLWNTTVGLKRTKRIESEVPEWIRARTRERLERDLRAFQWKLEKLNPGFDQARDVVSDVAVALQSGMELEVINKLIKSCIPHGQLHYEFDYFHGRSQCAYVGIDLVYGDPRKGFKGDGKPNSYLNEPMDLWLEC